MHLHRECAGDVPEESIGRYRDGGGPGTRTGSRSAKHRASDRPSSLSQQLQPCNWELFAPRVGPAQRLLGLSYVTEAFATLGCPLDTIEAGTVVELTGVSAKLDPRLISALHGILEDGGLIKELRQRGGDAVRVRTSAPLNKTAAHAIDEELLADAPYAVTHQLLHVVGSRLAECLTGDADATQIVFGQHRALLQEFYTTGMSDFVVASKLAAELLERIFASHSQNKLTAAGVSFRLTYSDISPSLVSAARQRYRKQYPNLPDNVDLEYTTLDIAQPPPPSLKGRFDAIISSNCIHATKSLTTSCHKARLMLRPGGFLAMVEITNEIPWMDLVFGFMKGWWLFDDGRRHCLANEKFWRTNLESAGFKRVLTYEDTEDQPVSKGKEGIDVLRPNPQVIVACT
ncbi:S-adenosyl-L-methionine-dependent methyltransferase [Rhypophila sp. PSN 637]